MSRPGPAGEVVVVTGAARGLGHAITVELLQRGAQVVAGYSADPAPLEALAEKWSGQIHPVPGDLREEATSQRLIEQANELGGPTAVIHNAAISRDGLLVRTSVQDWDEVQLVNLRGAFLLSKHAVKAMIRIRRGRLVYISSVSAVFGNSGQAAYAASKSGLEGLSRSVSQEYARFGIGTCVLAPGLINIGLGSRLPSQYQATKAGRFLLGAAEAEEIAAIAAFLASPTARHINATTVHADGGGMF
jgi:3-oxoacyl-[acyl-carrier protein] reductase